MDDVDILLLIVVPIGSMVLVGIIVFGWMIWDDYKTGHQKPKEKFFDGE